MARTRRQATSGAEAKARRAAARRRALKKQGEAQIDTFLRGVGVKDPSEFTDEAGARSLHYGSAQGTAFVQDLDGDVTLCVAADIMPLPSDKDLVVPLLRELLEHNTLITGPARFAVVEGSVYVTAASLVESMKDEDYAACINGVMVLADGVGDDLRKKFGGTTRKRAAR